MAICRVGHSSESTDYCDVCGSPMGAAATPDTVAPPPSDLAPGQRTTGVACPNCGVSNAPGALFCEACGYDYTTGTMPRPAPPLSVLDLDAPMPGVEAAGTDAASGGQPATSDQPQPSAAPELSAADSSQPPGDTQQPGDSGPTSEPLPPPSAGTLATSADSSVAAPSEGAVATPEPEDSFDWVVEIWIDPEWYAMQQSPDPMPSPGLPEILPLRKRTLLIGRPSRSRNVAPDIDCEPDSGISRRQADLSTDGSRWFIEDLGSANGTFVAEAAGPLPTDPIPTGRRRELNADERIYLGAWTRLVLRRATPEEQEAYASA